MANAYFVGASAHPGTGVSLTTSHGILIRQVPIAIAGSKLCAQAIMDDFKLSYPATYTAEAPPSTTLLDKLHSRPLLYRLEDVLVVVFPILVGIVIALIGVHLGATWPGARWLRAAVLGELRVWTGI